MLCTEEMGTLLSRYVDGELADKERKSIETHLETCASCRDVLNLFQRNDNVLNNALVGEAFGAQTVDAVMTEIRRLEEPLVVAPPLEDEPVTPVTMRQVIQVTRMWPFAAAAALMIACFGGFFALMKTSGGFSSGERTAMQNQVLALQAQIAEEQARAREDGQAGSDRISELAQRLKDVEVNLMLQTSKESTGIAYVNDAAIVVQANYSTDKFFPFEILRSREITPGRYANWERIKTELATPQYRDTNVEPGVNYMYQVRAIYRDSKYQRWEESAPVVQMLPKPGGQDPRRLMKIRFIAAPPDLKSATFEVSRYDNEKEIRVNFTVKVGEKIGGVRTINGKEMDFSTRHMLMSITPNDDMIWIGTNHVSRPSRLATLKTESGTLPLMLESFEYIPLLSK
jgi:anti-sigma factor RsiW